MGRFFSLILSQELYFRKYKLFHILQQTLHYFSFIRLFGVINSQCDHKTTMSLLLLVIDLLACLIVWTLLADQFEDLKSELWTFGLYVMICEHMHHHYGYFVIYSLVYIHCYKLFVLTSHRVSTGSKRVWNGVEKRTRNTGRVFRCNCCEWTGTGRLKSSKHKGEFIERFN